MSNTTTTTFKTELNSFSDGYYLTALKQHITTCLERWRQQKNEPHHPALEDSIKSQYKIKIKSNKTHKKSCIKLKPKIITPPNLGKAKATSQHTARKGPREYGCKVGIVAKLLSLTLLKRTRTVGTSTTPSEEVLAQSVKEEELITSSTSSATFDRDSAYSSLTRHKLSAKSSSTICTLLFGSSMTISDLTFLEIRDEHPDLDQEIRGILLSRAQNGATINEIRDDYRKLTGIRFPVPENITEFMLTIPNVMAYCNEYGTRIFNIRPTEKTTHLLDMVLQQKPQQDRQPISDREQRYSTNRNYYRERSRNQNYNPNNWRLNGSRREQLQRQTYYPQKQQPEILNSTKLYENKTAAGKDCFQSQAVVRAEKRNLSKDSEGFVENNWVYQDNCNYLFNRICNQANANQPLITQLMVSPNMNQLNPSSLAQPQQQQQTQFVTQPQPAVVPNNNDNNKQSNNFPNFYYPPLPSSSAQQPNGQQQNQQLPVQQLQQQPMTAMAPSSRSSSIFKVPILPPIARSSRSSSPTTNDSAYTDSDYEAHLLDFLLLGDDFFLYLARMELGCKFKKNLKRLESGFCVSGMTINGATKRINRYDQIQRSIIVNIGSVDIMQGKNLLKIEHDYRELLATLLKKGLNPILTTLAPLANYTHNQECKELLNSFNNFIKREGKQRNLVVIDIWGCLVNKKNQVMFDCFQNEPRRVTGTPEYHLFWNKIGRQRVLQLIGSQLEY